MSDSEEELTEAQARMSFKEVSEEINKAKKDPVASRMFVSGWDDEDEDVEVVTNPKENPDTHTLWAAENGELDTLRQLISDNQELVHVEDADGYTPLHRAAYSNNLDTVSFLLSKGANVAARTELGWTPLHSACKWNNYMVAARLLAHGADPRSLTDGSLTPLHLVSSISHCKATLLILLFREDCMDLAFQKNKAEETPEQLARRNGIYGPLFEMALPAASYIHSMSFTCNPYVRAQLTSQ